MDFNNHCCLNLFLMKHICVWFHWLSSHTRHSLYCRMHHFSFPAIPTSAESFIWQLHGKETTNKSNNKEVQDEATGYTFQTFRRLMKHRLIFRHRAQLMSWPLMMWILKGICAVTSGWTRCYTLMDVKASKSSARFFLASSGSSEGAAGSASSSSETGMESQSAP
jgi:hypothetical protein